MDSATLTTVVTTITGVVGGMYGGIRYGKQAALADAANSSTVATNTVEMLQTQVNHLEVVVAEKDTQLTQVTVRVSVLEDLVTQRAEVAEVHDVVKESKVILEKIASKVGA
ncbi:MAG TPA: hypothetical protein VIY48_01255 [Candidatus Paceibacterota bacterium]